MKPRSLYLSAAMLLMSSAVFAQWTKPTITGQAVVTDGETPQYLYNVDAGAFFLGANNWNTRASVDKNKGYQVKITDNDGTYSLIDYVVTKSAWLKTFADGEASIWVDDNNGANADTWTITPASGNTFKIGNTAFVGATLGTAPSVDTRLYFSTAEAVASAEDFYDLWVSVSVEEYEGLALAVAAYNAAVALKEAIDAAKAKYPTLDLTEEEAVYANTASTEEALKAALASVNKKVQEADAAAAEASATPENPQDLSNFIVNADFAENNGTGWSGTAFAFQSFANAEHYNKTYDTYQKLSNLPKGVYRLTTQAYYRAGWAADSYKNYKNGTNRNALLYATSDTTLTSPICNVFEGIEANNSLGGKEGKVEDGDYTYYIADNMETAKTYFDAGLYKDNNVVFAATEGEATIGVKKSVTVGGDWSIFNNFTLIYYGNGAAAYQMWMDQIVETLSVEEYENVEYVTGSYLEAYEAAVADHKTAASYEDVKANLAAVREAKAAIDANIAAWEKFRTVYDKADEVTGSGEVEGDAVEELSDYMMDLEVVLDNKEATTEELLALAAQVEEMINIAVSTGLKPGADFTNYLVNPAFSTGDWTGWTHEAASGGNVAVSASAKCAEAWNNSNFDIYQIVEGAPVGVYSIAMQGFYREGRGDTAWNLYFDEYGEPKESRPQSTAYVYMNDAKTPLANVFDYPVAKGELYSEQTYKAPDSLFWYPDGMVSAGEAFNEDKYKVEAYGLVAKKGDVMRVGVKGRSNNLGDSWAIFDNFILTYEGFKAEIIQPLLEAQLAKAGSGELMGKEILDEVETAKKAGDAALASGDGKKMFNALADLYALDTKMEESIALFVTLTDKWNALGEALSGAVCSATVKNEAMEYYSAVESAMSNKTYTNADAEEAIEKIAYYLCVIRIPAGVEEATDNDPVDLTSVLATPGFQDEDYQNSIEGWQNTTGYNFGNNATQKAALCLEFYEKDFNLYQDVNCLPAGTYRVGVQAFFRGAEESTPVLYAKAGAAADSITANIIARDSQYAEENFSDGTAELKDAEEQVIGYVPNDMVSSAAFFENDFYHNSLIVKLGEGETLRIGVAAKDHKEKDWFIMDNFSLTYFGANSTRVEGAETAIEEVAADAHAVKTEIYNLNGMKVAGLQQGINIVRTTLSNGQMIIRKVSVK